MIFLNLLTGLLLTGALFFFIAGTIGLLRFPDLYSRLHALTKADNLGLGLTMLALMLQAGSWTEIFKLGLIWIIVLAASATVCFLIGNEAYRRGQLPCGKPDGQTGGPAPPETGRPA
jgi:multicomponent Na+:H+ antiporter subunit G